MPDILIILPSAKHAHPLFNYFLKPIIMMINCMMQLLNKLFLPTWLGLNHTLFQDRFAHGLDGTAHNLLRPRCKVYDAFNRINPYLEGVGMRIGIVWNKTDYPFR